MIFCIKHFLQDNNSLKKKSFKNYSSKKLKKKIKGKKEKKEKKKEKKMKKENKRKYMFDFCIYFVFCGDKEKCHF